ncbi:HAD-IIA family hydrolase [Gordonia sinesedis]
MTFGLLLDIDGVLVTSWRALPGSVDALAALSARGNPRMFLTNTTSRSRAQIAATLAEAGFDVRPDEILTAATLTADFVAANYPGKRVWVLNEGPIAEDMAVLPLTDGPADADVVVLGGAGAVFTHRALSTVLEKILDDVPVIAMHRSMIWSTAAGLSVDTGVYLAGLERAAGRSIRAIGKPSPLGFQAAVEKLGLEPTQVVMVGDDMHNDVLGAQAAALIGVLVRTGKFREEALRALQRDEYGPVPDHVIDSLADLPDLLDVIES